MRGCDWDGCQNSCHHRILACLACRSPCAVKCPEMSPRGKHFSGTARGKHISGTASRSPGHLVTAKMTACGWLRGTARASLLPWTLPWPSIITWASQRLMLPGSGRGTKPQDCVQDATFEMERKRNRPEKYNRELVHKTIRGVEKVSAVCAQTLNLNHQTRLLDSINMQGTSQRVVSALWGAVEGSSRASLAWVFRDAALCPPEQLPLPGTSPEMLWLTS